MSKVKRFQLRLNTEVSDLLICWFADFLIFIFEGFLTGDKTTFFDRLKMQLNQGPLHLAPL